MTETERLRAALRLGTARRRRLTSAKGCQVEVDIGGARVPCREALAIARHELRCSEERMT